MAIEAPGPYSLRPIFAHGMQFFDDVKDIAAATATCRKYREWSNQIFGFWQSMANRCGLPYVQNGDGTQRENPKYDLFVISRFMISAKKIERLFGKVVGSLLPISDIWFNMFARDVPDPHEEGTLFRDSYQLMVDPSHVQRVVNGETPLDIDGEGNLHEVDPQVVEERTLTIPLSLRNICLLSKYPLSGREHLPVFAENAMFQEKHELTTSFPQYMRTLVMRKTHLKKTIDLWLYHLQLQYVQEPNIGLEIATPRQRALYSALSILTTGSCPDIDIFIAGAGVFVIQGTTTQHLITGNFKPKTGLDIYYGHARKINNAVVPIAIADAPELIEALRFSRLTISEGKKQCSIL